MIPFSSSYQCRQGLSYVVHVVSAFLLTRYNKIMFGDTFDVRQTVWKQIHKKQSHAVSKVGKNITTCKVWTEHVNNVVDA